jgi:hypothetical protein
MPHRQGFNQSMSCADICCGAEEKPGLFARKVRAPQVGALLVARRLDPLEELTHSDFLFAVRDWIAKRAGALL